MSFLAARPEVSRMGVVLELCSFLISEDVTFWRGGTELVISRPYLGLKSAHLLFITTTERLR